MRRPPRLALLFAGACVAVSFTAGAGAASLDYSHLRGCVIRSEDPEEAGAADFGTDCERRPANTTAVVQACSKNVGAYCTRQLKRLTEPDADGDPGELLPILQGVERSYYLNRRVHDTLNGDPLVELIVLDPKASSLSARRIAVTGCPEGKGRIHTVHLLNLGVVGSTELWSEWRAQGTGELDRVAGFICTRR